VVLASRARRKEPSADALKAAKSSALLICVDTRASEVEAGECGFRARHAPAAVGAARSGGGARARAAER